LLDIFHHPNSLLHDMGNGHLEATNIIRLVQKALMQARFDRNYNVAVSAPPKEILGVHASELFDLVKASQSKGKYRFTPDTIANEYTFQAALTAAGGAIQTAVNLHHNNSFAMLRPPGHHATLSAAMGFCFFNNIAIAASHLLKTRVKRIAIIDVDNHHGNGTQDIFYNNPNVLYASLHASPEIAYPGTGFSDEVGGRDGAGRTINIPLPYQTDDTDYLFAFDTIVDPIIRQFKPEMILVSLGLDGLLHDPYGMLGLSSAGFADIGFRIARLNKDLTKYNVGVFLEGGYKYDEIGKAAVEFFNGLLFPEEYEKSILNPSDRIQKIVHHVRSIQRHYWYTI